VEETYYDVPGVELDAEMSQRILDSGDDYSKQTARLAQFIYDYRGQFRAELERRSFIAHDLPRSDGFDLAAVDGGSAIEPHGGGALIAAIAYKCTINDEKQRGKVDTISVPNNINLEAFATLLRMHLEFSLLAKDQLDTDQLVVLDHSFWGVLQAVSRALATYKSLRQNLLSKRLFQDAMQDAWLVLFKRSLGAEGSFLHMIRNKQVISLSKTGVSKYYLNVLLDDFKEASSDDRRLASNLNDRALLTHVLREGEYTMPMSLYVTEKESGDIKVWNRSRFATAFDPKADGRDPFEARHHVLDEYGIPRDDGRELQGRRIFVTYYRPHDWSRVYRIEFHELMLRGKDGSGFDLSGQGERFQKVLASVRHSTNRETMEPICQVLADIRSKAATACAMRVLPERSFYQLRDRYRDDSAMLDIVDTLLSRERT